MKKSFFILLAIVYFASSAGATIHFHYCMDKLVGIGMHGSESDICDKCGMKKQRGCCKEESRQIKVSDDQKPASQFFLQVVKGEYVTPAYSIEPGACIASHDLHFQASTNGPPYGSICIYKFLCVYRI